VDASPLHARKRLAFLATWLCAAIVSACLDERVVECADGRMCPAGLACDAAHQGCVLPEQLERCSGRAESADCSYRGVARGACYDGVCLPAGCGNAILDRASGEVCDDGNRFHGDGCSADCRSEEWCGNGEVDVSIGEACDVGTEPSDWCRADCSTVRCGDGTVDPEVFEQCDDGAENSALPDAACRPNCQARRCGDGILDSDEVCDDGNLLSGDGCSAACKSDERCGNGIVDVAAGESCEPNASNVGWCRPDCVTVRCGDGIVDRDVFEGCDQGAKNSASPDAECRPNCQPRRCGDGIQDSDEACDDGNQVDADGCSHDCASREVCGNGYVDLRVGEQCDDRNFLGHDGCSSRCRSEPPVWRQLSGQATDMGTVVAYDASRDAVVTFAWNHTYELRGTSWELLSPPHLPRVSYNPGMAWDSERRRVVLFGGERQVTLDETWEWDGTDWIQRLPRSRVPRARFNPVLTYDVVGRRTIMFGGSPHVGTWAWDGDDWRELTATNEPPEGTWVATFDPVAGRVVAFDHDAFWYLEGDAWRSELAPLPAPAPFPNGRGSRDASLVFDAARRRLVYLDMAGHSSSAPLMYEWDGSTWEPKALPPLPRFVNNTRLVYRTARQRLTLVTAESVWERDGDSWKQVSGRVEPPKRERSAMVYDPLRGTTMLFGGFFNRAEPTGYDLVGLDDTWTWDGTTWMRETPDTFPSSRSGHAMAYDPARRQVVMFGGSVTISHLLDDTWTWDGENWSQAETPIAPVARSNHGMTYDTARGQVVMFGGGQAEGGCSGDMWTWDGQGWTERFASEAPVKRCGHGMSYDPIRREVVLVGGDGEGSLYSDQPTWSWDGARWAQADLPGLTFRTGFGMTYDPNQQATLLIGGTFDDNVHTWSLPVGLADPWEPLPIPFSSDPQVHGQNAVYESVRGRTLVFVASDKPLWELSYRAEGELYEVCQHGHDIDGDGLIGCADPDCWAYCTPLCPPGAECDEALPHCGDGACNPALETCRMCPGDCGACAPVCGDFVCDPGESAASCPGDCNKPAPAAEDSQ
jgi:cysteine-rich repeat protein